MMKNNPGRLVTLIVTSIICLLPICLSLVVYDDLPERAAMQWNLEGNPNWYAHKAVMAFGIPLFLMALNIGVHFILYSDPKRENSSKVMQIFSLWFISLLSLVVVPLMLFMNLGINVPLIMIIFIFIGIICIILGNYMPKNRQNYSIGIRTSWTLNDPENWNKTHRLAGILWIICGILFIIIAFLPLQNITVIVILLLILIMMIVVPIIYSWYLYKKIERN